MSASDDIIELDSEGNFVVPDVEPVGAGKSTRVEIETVESEENFVTGESHVAPVKGRGKVEKTSSEVLEGIAVGEYKIFKYANKIDVLVHLDQPSSSVKGVTVDAGTLKIAFDKASSLTVDISDYIAASDGAAAAAYSYQGFLSIRFEIA